MRFSKRRFLSSESGRRVKHLLGSHLDVLDGTEGHDVPGFPYQLIDYEVDGGKFQLYPLMPEWCEKELMNSEGTTRNGG